MRIRLLSTAATALAIVAATPACAADAAPAAAEPTQVSTATLQEIVVTAQRRSQSLQKTAVPVTVVSGDALAAQGVSRPQDLDKAVAGLNLSPVGASNQVYLRGVGTFAINAFSDSAVAFNLDGVFLVYPGMIGGNFFDIARVEVLKGPQGTLYGRNATAGAINLISQKPKLGELGELGGDLSIEAGDYNLIRAEGALNVPVSSDLALRASGQVVSRDGYFTDGSGDDKSESARLQALYQPSSTFSLVIKGDYAHIHGRGEPNVTLGSDATADRWAGPSTAAGNAQLVLANTYGSDRGSPIPFGPYGPGANFPLIDNQSYQHAVLYGIEAEATLNLGFATLTALPAWRHMSIDSVVEPGFYFHNGATAHQESFELRLASAPGQSLKWLIGGYALGSTILSDLDVQQGVDAQYETVYQSGQSYSAFGEATYSVTPAFRLTGGLRYTSETKDQSGTSDLRQFVVPAGPFAPPIPLPPFAQDTDFQITGHLTNHNVSGRAGVEFDASPQNLLYATYSTGFKAGGFNPDIAPNTFQPEKLTAYTIGSKNRFFGDRLQINLEGFYWDYRNHQENVLGPLNANPQAFAPFTRNIGKATDKGVNAEVLAKPTRDDLLTANVEYLDAKFDDFTFSVPNQVAPVPGIQTTCGESSSNGLTTIDCSGKPFTRAPKWTALLGYQHTLDLGGHGTLRAGVDAKITSSYYIATDYIANELQKSATVANASLTYETPDGRWSLTGYVRNIGNIAVANGGFEHPFIPGLVYGTIGAPRTYGAILKAKF
jgi:iron complex outermembrane receptor protein